VQFLDSRGDSESGSQSDFVPAGVAAEGGADFPKTSGADDDIPF
jgi:hypothetical protein